MSSLHAKVAGLIGRGLDGFRERRTVQLQPSGVPELDTVLGGGFPRGSVVELCGPASSGRTSLAFSLLAQVTEQQESCAFVDVSDSLDPFSLAAAGVELPRLLWIRCGESGDERRSLQPSSYFSEKEETRKSDYPDPVGRKQMLRGGWSHPRESMRGVDQAIPRLIGKPAVSESARIHVVARCSGEQVERDRQLPRRGIRAPRSLPAVGESFALREEVKSASPAKPWSRLEQALKSTDLLLHSGGWGVVVFDLGGISWTDASRINLSVWFRFRRAVENTATILLLVGEEPCAKSCASVVLQCWQKAGNWRHAAPHGQTRASTFEGFEIQGEVIRSRVQSQPADLVRWQTSRP